MTDAVAENEFARKHKYPNTFKADIFIPCPNCGQNPSPTKEDGHCGKCGAWLLVAQKGELSKQIKKDKPEMKNKWYTNKCVVCKQQISQNLHEILQPELFVCWNCMENARQMLAIKAFAKDVNVKIDFGMIEKAEVEKIKTVFNIGELDNGNG